MIIQSLLDTDLYKFTMMQVVLHHFPGAQVEYRFRCRTEGVDLRSHLDAIRAEIAALYALRFREEELAYLRNLRFMKSDFVDFLGLFQFNEKYLRLGAGEGPGEIDITIRGPWLHTILFEIPVLAIISEVYFRRTQPRPDVDAGRRRLQAKIDLVRTVEPELEFKISDFGTRRRFSGAWHEEVLQTLKREMPQYFAGSSNVWFAMRNNLTPLGTLGHEYMQACQALGPRLRDSQTFAFDKWAQEYRGDLGIAISDTYGVDAFLRDFCRVFVLEPAEKISARLQEFPLIARRRRSRSRTLQPRRSAAPRSVTTIPASLRGVATGPESFSTTREAGSRVMAAPPAD